MTTSRTSRLAKPTGDDAVPDGTKAYFATRARLHMHNLILQEFKQSGINRATLARRMAVAPEIVTRLLNAPTNITVTTAAKMLFAMAGREPTFGVHDPFAGVKRNRSTQLKPEVQSLE